MKKPTHSLDRAMRDGGHYMITLLVHKSGLSYDGNGATLADEMVDQGKQNGHAWVRLVAPGESIDECHGHTGEEGRDPTAPQGGKTFSQAIINLQKKHPPKALLASPYADPLNPGLFLHHVFNDGYDHGDNPRHVPNFEATFCVSQNQFRRAQDYAASFDYQKFGGFAAGCAFYAAGLLDAAGLGAYQKDCRRTFTLPDTTPYRILWGAITLKTIRIATPDTPNYEKARHISHVYPDALADKVASLPERPLSFYKGRQTG